MTGPNNLYGILPAVVRYDKDLPSSAKLIFAELTVLCHKEGFCWATNGYFADVFSVSKITVSRWIAALKDKGYINVSMARRDDTSKEVIRRITINEDLLTKMLRGINKNVNPPIQKEQGVLTKTSIPPMQKCKGGINKNVKEKYTDLSNKKEEYIESPSKVVPTFKVHTPPEREVPPVPDDLLTYYCKFNPTPKMAEKEKLAIWAEQYTKEKVKDAIDVAIENEAHHIKYIGRVLENNKGGSIKHDNMGGHTGQGKGVDVGEWADRLAAEYNL